MLEKLARSKDWSSLSPFICSENKTLWIQTLSWQKMLEKHEKPPRDKNPTIYNKEKCICSHHTRWVCRIKEHLNGFLVVFINDDGKISSEIFTILEQYKECWWREFTTLNFLCPFFHTHAPKKLEFLSQESHLFQCNVTTQAYWAHSKVKMKMSVVKRATWPNIIKILHSFLQMFITRLTSVCPWQAFPA